MSDGDTPISPLRRLMNAVGRVVCVDRFAPLPRDLMQRLSDAALAFNDECVREGFSTSAHPHGEALLLLAAHTAASYPDRQEPLTALKAAWQLLVALNAPPEVAAAPDPRWEVTAGLMG